MFHGLWPRKVHPKTLDENRRFDKLHAETLTARDYHDDTQGLPPLESWSSIQG